MPNHGEHYEHVMVCPRCKSWRIRKRKGFHIMARWRCRKCRKTFFSPLEQVWMFPLGSRPWRGLKLKDR